MSLTYRDISALLELDAAWREFIAEAALLISVLPDDQQEEAFAAFEQFLHVMQSSELSRIP